MSNGELELFTKNDTGDLVAYTPPSFQETLPEDLREHESLKEITDTEQLAKAHIDLVSAQQPTRPESADEYAVEIPENFPIVEDDLKLFKQSAHDLNLTQAQFEGVMKAYLEREIRLAEQYKDDIKAHRESAYSELRQEFGDTADEKLKKAGQILSALGDKLGEGMKDKFAKWMDDTKFGDDPMAIRILAAASEFISEDLWATGEHETGEIERPASADGGHRLKFRSMGDK